MEFELEAIGKQLPIIIIGRLAGLARATHCM
jgi:hypothetical protein